MQCHSLLVLNVQRKCLLYIWGLRWGCLWGDTIALRVIGVVAGHFLGHKRFKMTMPQNTFQPIRANLTLHNPDSDSLDATSKDPLWHSRSLMEHFMKNSAMVVVPVGTSIFNENKAHTKERTKANTFLPNKPDEYGIQCCIVVGMRHCYVSSIFDNQFGNKNGLLAL